jgi:release factor glutamine methyltransferase
MKNVGSALKWAVPELLRNRVESPRRTAELLLGHVLGWDRTRVLAHPESTLLSEIVYQFAALVRRRAEGEPLQYITGRQEFYGLPFKVTPAVLIPRPETEILVEQAIMLAKDIGVPRIRFADVGTGSGCIGVSFAHEVPGAVGWAIDISVDALAVARENAARNGVQNRIAFLRGDFLEGFPPNPCFDLVLSNPPYVAVDDAAALPATVRDHEPPVALFSGGSGLDSYQRLIPQAATRIVAGGGLLLEVGAGMSGPVKSLAEQAGFSVQAIVEDLQGIPRCILARRGHG